MGHRENRRAGGFIDGEGMNRPGGFADPTNASVFNVGSLTFSVEICAEVGEAWKELQARGMDQQQEGPHVQILVSHGSALRSSAEARRPSGIGLLSDSNFRYKQEEDEYADAGIRQAFKSGAKFNPKTATKSIEGSNKLNEMYLGTYNV